VIELAYTESSSGDECASMREAPIPSLSSPTIPYTTFHPWTSNYTFKSELNTFDQFAIDGTYFSYGDKLYHIYSCWYDAYTSWPSMLCITQMSNPWTVSSDLCQRTIISKPTQPWEKTPYNRTINDRLSSNEGPEQLTNPYTNQTFVIYSAARSDNADYCLGLLEFNKDKDPNADPLDIKYWFKNEDGCVFEQNPPEETYGVGHASFTTSPDGTQDWIVYHGMRDPTNGWSARTIRTQQFTWDKKSGWPVFPKPGYGPYPIPSGQ
jgi:GH43 family beta-xylosidase